MAQPIYQDKSNYNYADDAVQCVHNGAVYNDHQYRTNDIYTIDDDKKSNDNINQNQNQKQTNSNNNQDASILIAKKKQKRLLKERRRQLLNDPNCFPKRYEVKVLARVRVDKSLTSEYITDLPEGCIVIVEEICKRRARISKPICGWLSAVSKFGAEILLPTSKYVKNHAKVSSKTFLNQDQKQVTQLKLGGNYSPATQMNPVYAPMDVPVDEPIYHDDYMANVYQQQHVQPQQYQDQIDIVNNSPQSINSFGNMPPVPYITNDYIPEPNSYCAHPAAGNCLNNQSPDVYPLCIEDTNTLCVQDIESAIKQLLHERGVRETDPDYLDKFTELAYEIL